MSSLRWKSVDGVLTTFGAFAFYKVEADEIESLGQFCNARFLLIDGNSTLQLFGPEGLEIFALGGVI